jgi:hypothetical protein
MGIFDVHAEAFTRHNLNGKAFQESSHVVGCDGILCDSQVSLFSYGLNFYKTYIAMQLLFYNSVFKYICGVVLPSPCSILADSHYDPS